MSQDMFNPENESKPNIVDWGKVGDYIIGTFVGADHGIKTKFGVNSIYHIKVSEGSIHKMVGKQVAEKPTVLNAGEMWDVWGRNDLFNGQMNGLKEGQKLGLKYVEDKPSQFGNDAKIVKLFTKGEMDQEYLDSKEITAKDLQ